MIKIERFDGRKELDELLKQFVSEPTNTEIIEVTKFSKGAVSGIMSGKIKPSEDFIDKFKKGFKIIETKTPPVDSEGDSLNHYEKIIKYYVDLTDRIMKDANRLSEELEFERSKNNKQ